MRFLSPKLVVIILIIFVCIQSIRIDVTYNNAIININLVVGREGEGTTVKDLKLKLFKNNHVEYSIYVQRIKYVYRGNSIELANDFNLLWIPSILSDLIVLNCELELPVSKHLMVYISHFSRFKNVDDGIYTFDDNEEFSLQQLKKKIYDKSLNQCRRNVPVSLQQLRVRNADGASELTDEYFTTYKILDPFTYVMVTIGSVKVDIKGYQLAFNIMNDGLKKVGDLPGGRVTISPQNVAYIRERISNELGLYSDSKVLMFYYRETVMDIRLLNSQDEQRHVVLLKKDAVAQGYNPDNDDRIFYVVSPERVDEEFVSEWLEMNYINF